MNVPMDPDFVARFFGKTGSEAPYRPKPKRESKPLPQIHGKRIDGVLYLLADDVADALESQDSKVNRRLIDRIRRSS